MPLFAIVIAAFVLHDEPITLNRLVGLLVGFGGAALLASPNLGESAPEVSATAALMGEIAVARRGAVVRHRHGLCPPPDHGPEAGARSGRGSSSGHRHRDRVGPGGLVAAPVRRPRGRVRASRGWHPGAATRPCGLVRGDLAGRARLGYRLHPVLSSRAFLGRDPDIAGDLCHAHRGHHPGFVVLGEQLHPAEIAGLARSSSAAWSSPTQRSAARVLYQRRMPAP